MYENTSCGKCVILCTYLCGACMIQRSLWERRKGVVGVRELASAAIDHIVIYKF